MRRKKNENTLTEVFAQMFTHGPNRDKFRQAQLKSIWRQEMGDFIADRTSRLNYNRGILTINTDSAPLKQELVNSRQQIILRLNRFIGQDLIADLKIF